ncbi:9828_t:CDS:1, partial [Acaulospora colombiana]
LQWKTIHLSWWGDNDDRKFVISDERIELYAMNIAVSIVIFAPSTPSSHLQVS